MSYITKSNASKIIQPIKKFNTNSKGIVYEHMKIYFFSKYEEQYLLMYKDLFKNPESFINQYYEKLIIEDTGEFVIEGSAPSYHNDLDCNLMYRDMINYKLPDDIKNKGKKTIKEFREWFKSVKYLLELEKYDIFTARLFNRWRINTNMNSFKINNSGSEKIDNIDIDKLIININNQIKRAGKYYYAGEKNNKILRKFSRISFIANKEKIYGNDTGYSDKEVQDFLINYNQEFKNPLKKNLITYYKIKYNPEIKMEGKLLNQIGFKPCLKCHN